MFTGIVQRVGRIVSIDAAPHGRVVRIDAGGAWSPALGVGDSLAVSGCCLTVAAIDEGLLRFDVIAQTLALTTLGDRRAGDRVNLEPPVTPTSFLGGHIVQGHVDGVATVSAVRDAPGDRRVIIEPPAALLPFIVERGSIAVDGVSLTVAGLDERAFEVALIPTTLDATTLGALSPGDRMNIETDYVVKALARMRAFG